MASWTLPLLGLFFSDAFPVGPLTSHNIANATWAAEEILKTLGSWTPDLHSLLFGDAGADGEAPPFSRAVLFRCFGHSAPVCRLVVELRYARGSGRAGR